MGMQGPPEKPLEPDDVGQHITVQVNCDGGGLQSKYRLKFTLFQYDISMFLWIICADMEISAHGEYYKACSLEL
jgi:hypothetical protein